MKTKQKVKINNQKPAKSQGGFGQVNFFVSEKLENGKYRTKKGSIVTVSGKYSGIAKVEFDWLEEDACIDCVPEPYPEEFGINDYRLIWSCNYCDGGSAKLELIR
ncbi:hypothetical protein H8E88_35635 [candidate division KSB1 bacterium]|nr:hypothetical protein [candidate division KSB1 bacterium]